jgi:hypothetical protein
MRGKILVWNIDPVIGDAPGFFPALNFFSYAAYSIIDPGLAPASPTTPPPVFFDNYLRRPNFRRRH